MLEIGHDPSLTAILWDGLERKTRLPARMIDFFEPSGPTPIRPDNQRVYHRFYLRGKAFLFRKSDCLGIYTVDTSRQGIRLFAPVQLMPKERCQIRLPNGKNYQVRVVRCRRIGDGCYDCGAKFVLGS
jgi:PilZ domain